MAVSHKWLHNWMHKAGYQCWCEPEPDIIVGSRELVKEFFVADDPKSESRNPDYQGDKPTGPRPTEDKREWQHTQDSRCYRKEKPIFVDPSDVPLPCRNCGDNDWQSKGIVKRLIGTKEVIYREKS